MPVMRVYVHQFDGVTTFQGLPLAAGLLVATARADTRLRGTTFSIRTVRADPASITYEAPDVLAFSTYVWNERYSLEIARRAKQRHPEACVIFGGPSVPRRQERVSRFFAMHTFVDALVLGEGELAFRDILHALLDHAPLADVAGLALPDGLTRPRARIEDLSQTASPFLDGTFDSLHMPTAAVIETNRGCPFACTFCDWGQAIASKVHDVPLERLIAELEWTAARRIPYLYIVDANYGIRRRDLDIVREIVRIKARAGFPEYVFFHLTKNATERHLDLVLALRDAGIGTQLTLSAQDFEPRVLAAVKRANIRIDSAVNLRRICHERGISTANELILGLPEQTYDSFASSMVQAVTPWPLDAFQLYLARMIENAEMSSSENRTRYGIQTRNVRMAQFHHADSSGPVPELEEIVVGTNAMSITDWRKAFKYGFFLSAAHNLRLLHAVLPFVNIRSFVEAMLAGGVADVLNRYADAILDSEAMVLPAEGTGDHLWAPEDAVLIAALSDPDRFYGEAARLMPDGLSREAVRYQQFITPALDGGRVRSESFDYDFQSERTRRTDLMWSPLIIASDLKEFVLAYLAAVHSRRPTGWIAANHTEGAHPLGERNFEIGRVGDLKFQEWKS